MANPGLYRNPSAFPLGPEPNVQTVTSSLPPGVTMVTPPTHPHTYYLAGSAPAAQLFPSPVMVTPPTHPHTYYLAGSAPSAPVEAQQSSLVHHGYHPSPATPLNWHPPTPTVYPVAQGGDFAVVSPPTSYPVVVPQAHPPLTHTATGDPANMSANNNGNNPSRRNARRNRTKRRVSRRRRRNTRRN